MFLGQHPPNSLIKQIQLYLFTREKMFLSQYPPNSLINEYISLYINTRKKKCFQASIPWSPPQKMSVFSQVVLEIGQSGARRGLELSQLDYRFLSPFIAFIISLFYPDLDKEGIKERRVGTRASQSPRFCGAWKCPGLVPKPSAGLNIFLFPLLLCPFFLVFQGDSGEREEKERRREERERGRKQCTEGYGEGFIEEVMMRKRSLG